MLDRRAPVLPPSRADLLVEQRRLTEDNLYLRRSWCRERRLLHFVINLHEPGKVSDPRCICDQGPHDPMRDIEVRPSGEDSSS